MVDHLCLRHESTQVILRTPSVNPATHIYVLLSPVSPNRYYLLCTWPGSFVSIIYDILTIDLPFIDLTFAPQYPSSILQVILSIWSLTFSSAIFREKKKEKKKPKENFIMAKYFNHSSNNCNQLQQFTNKSVFASCYSVDESTAAVKGFHYCTKTGAGMGYLAIFNSFLIYADGQSLILFVCRSTVVSLRSPQDRSPVLQVLPLMPPYPLTWRAAGRVTVCRNTKGRQRIPFRESVRGSSAINCP